MKKAESSKKKKIKNKKWIVVFSTSSNQFTGFYMMSTLEFNELIFFDDLRLIG